MSVPSFDLVIFDCDGVLVDSEPIANRILAERLRKVGLHMPEEEVMRKFVGRTREGCLQAFAEIAAGRRPDQLKVRLFMSELGKTGIRANREYENPQNDITPEENVRRFREHLLRELPKLYPGIMDAH